MPRRFEESKRFAKLFEEAGTTTSTSLAYGYGFGHDMFCMFPDFGPYPEASEPTRELARSIKEAGALAPYSEAIKKVVSIPVIIVNILTPQQGERILEKGKADLVAFARGLIADPESPAR